MPKQKTNRSARKRFKITGTGKFKRHKAYARHLMTSKSPKRKRQLGKAVMVHSSDEKRVSCLLKA